MSEKMNGGGNTEVRSVVMTFYFSNVNVTAVCIITAGNNLCVKRKE
jgi:hypothetical protein